MERCLTDLEERPRIGTDWRDLPFGAYHQGTTGFLGSSGWKRWPRRRKPAGINLREGKLTANRPIITGLLHLLTGLRSHPQDNGGG